MYIFLKLFDNNRITFIILAINTFIRMFGFSVKMLEHSRSFEAKYDPRFISQ